MFQSVRPNSQIYVLHKGDSPRLELGSVVSQSLPRPKYQVPPTFGQPQETVVDLVVKVNGQTFNYKNLPSTADVAETFVDNEMITVADSREAMNAEILSLKQRSIDIINSLDYHRQVATSCEKLLSDLNPEYAEKQTQKEEIEVLKGQMLEVSKSLTELMATNKLLVEKLSLKEEKQ